MALGSAAWVTRVDFKDDELHVEHNSDDTDANMHYSRLHLMAKLKETVPGLAMNE